MHAFTKILGLKLHRVENKVSNKSLGDDKEVLDGN